MKMTAQPNAVPPIPEGPSTVMPWIISRDTAKLLDFLKQAFGAQELTRLYNEDGTIAHAEAKIGDSIVGGFDAREGWPDTPCFLLCWLLVASVGQNGPVRTSHDDTCSLPIPHHKNTISSIKSLIFTKGNVYRAEDSHVSHLHDTLLSSVAQPLLRRLDQTGHHLSHTGDADRPGP
jgi:hypothetical protein